jgi:hypothetical protein
MNTMVIYSFVKIRKHIFQIGYSGILLFLKWVIKHSFSGILNSGIVYSRVARIIFFGIAAMLKNSNFDCR